MEAVTMVAFLVGLLILGLIMSAVVGGVYYVLARPQGVSYRETIRQWWVLALGYLDACVFIAIVWTILYNA